MKSISQLVATDPAAAISASDAFEVTQGSASKGALASQIKTYVLAGLAGSAIANTPAGSISATTVQAAINELDAEKQPLDATLTAIAAFNTNGLITQTAADTFTGRTITGTAGEIDVANGNGVSGNPTISLPATIVLTGHNITNGTFNTTGDITGKGSTTLGTLSSSLQYSNFTNAGIYSQRYDIAGSVTMEVKQNYGITAATQKILHDWQFGSGGAFGAVAGRMYVEATDTWAAAGNRSARMSFWTCNAGTAAEKFGIEADGSLTMGASSFVIFDGNRVLTLRSYTIGTLPTAAAGKEVYCSDLGGGASVLVSNASVWMRTTPGYQVVSTDVDFTLTVLTSAENQRHTGTLTANRTITLSTTNAYAGARFRVTRTGSGAFNLSVGGLKNLTTNTWAEVVYDGSAWYLAAYGAL